MYEGIRMTRRGCNEADGVLEKTRPDQAEPPPRRPQRTRGTEDRGNSLRIDHKGSTGLDRPAQGAGRLSVVRTHLAHPLRSPGGKPPASKGEGLGLCGSPEVCAKAVQ